MNKYNLIKNAEKAEKIVDTITDVVLFGSVIAAISFIIDIIVGRRKDDDK